MVRGMMCLCFVMGCSKAVKPSPAAADMLTNEQVVFAFFGAMGDGDVKAIEALVAEDYKQHSPLVADGRQGIIDAIPMFSGVEATTHRVIVDGDKVALHQTYRFPDHTTQVAFDVFLVKGGQLVEHWDALQPEVLAADTVSGRSMTDGPAAVQDLSKTADNRKLVTDFVRVVLTDGDFSRLAEFISIDQYDQHNPGVADGLDGLGALAAGLEEAGLTFYYERSPLVVAQGDFVMVGSEGVFGPIESPGAAIFYDLWRVEDGKIVEHWDVVPPEVSEVLPHGNGYF